MPLIPVLHLGQGVLGYFYGYHCLDWGHWEPCGFSAMGNLRGEEGTQSEIKIGPKFFLNNSLKKLKNSFELALHVQLVLYMSSK